MTPEMPRERSLTVQILFLLSLALLPLGAIAVWQTQRISNQAERQLETALLLRTERAAGETRLLAERAYGALEILRAAAPMLIQDPGRCAETMESLVATSPLFAQVRYTAANGAVLCVSGTEAGSEVPIAPRTEIDANERGSLTIKRIDGNGTRYALSITQFVGGGTNDDPTGFVSVTMPAADLAVPDLVSSSDTPLGLVTFDTGGTILTSTFGDADTTANLPSDRDLQSLVDRSAEVFRAGTTGGQDRTFAVVPLVPGAAYAMTIWPSETSSETGLDRLAADAFLPLLMWVATLMVAFIALERLVIRHIKVLSRQMRTFARTRRLISKPVLAASGTELRGIETDFRDMAQSILQDEAQLEDNLREKNVLLKEVHHRVKNNLQLITSIMNMQIRRVQSDEARDILRRLHERIMSLALVHRALYQSPEINRIDAGALIADLGNKLVQAANRSGRVRLRTNIVPVELLPEQAVPLSLLVTEAMTNAIEHSSAAKNGDVEISLTFGQDAGEAKVLLESAASKIEKKSGGPERGLGHQLIRAFETQLGGTLSMGENDGRYVVDVRFPVRTQTIETLDY